MILNILIFLLKSIILKINKKLITRNLNVIYFKFETFHSNMK